MKKSELKELVKEIIQEERRKLTEIDTPSAIGGAIAGYVLATARSALDGTVQKSVADAEHNPQIKHAEEGVKDAIRELAEVLEDELGDTFDEKYKNFQNRFQKLTIPTPPPGVKVPKLKIKKYKM